MTSEVTQSKINAIDPGLTDEQWYDLLKSSIHEPGNLPSWPSNYTQEVFVGFSGEAALSEAFRFFQRVRDSSTRFNPKSKVLDFGVGWGRIIRCFYRDISVDNLYGIDVDPVILGEALRTNVKGNLQLIDSKGSLPFPDQFMDVTYAFSVFSHLSEPSATHWLSELMRILKPGGTLVFTSTTRRFLDLCHGCKKKPQKDRNVYEERYAAMFNDPNKAIEAYVKGNHVFAHAKGNADVLEESDYGWASVPLEWVRNVLGKQSSSITFSDDGSFEQGVFVVKK